ncbi:MmpS family transport accessory protein [Nocardia sp. 852002-20019_SCH5090214]|uniref:MmpS family transport accessory protein n=1 Tax=Nocardia sp. 852002-20019_SCH5090214 TaxID=1834087 RepID=UPI0009EE957E|nr:MmpS family transport accessory protein [Nocardia sp. 852002-20019_SCH5090214]
MSTPYPQQQPPYPPQPPQPPQKKRKVWPWVLLAVVILFFGGCFAIVGTAGKKVSDAVDQASSSIASAASQTHAPGEAAGPAPAAPPPLTAKPNTGKGKTVVYEVISDADTLNNVSYFDENSDMKQEISPSAPWNKTLVNTSTVVIAGLGAQTTGTSVTCRITVDGKVKDEKTSTGKYAVVNCTAPSF